MGNAHAMKPMPSVAEVKAPTSSSKSGSNSSGRGRGQAFDTESLASTILMKKKKQLLSVGNSHAQKPLPSLLGGPEDEMSEEDPENFNPDELAFAVLEKVEGLPELDIALAKDDYTENTEPTHEMSEVSGRLSCSTDRYSKSSRNTNGSKSNTNKQSSKNKQRERDFSSCLQKEIMAHISKLDSRQVLSKLERMAKTDDHAKQLLKAVRRSPDSALMNLNGDGSMSTLYSN